MKVHGRRWILVGVVGGIALTLGLLFSGSLNAWAGQTAAPVQGWTTVFTDTFDSSAALWTITDDTGGAYSWGRAPYMFDMGSTYLTDHGLWAAGGGTVGSTQTWPTGTYTHSMTTLAVAGPFTPTQSIFQAQVELTLLNEVAAGDTLFIGLSGDGEHFDGITITDNSTIWLPVRWQTDELRDSASVWIALRFVSDAAGVSTGPVVDNVRLSFNYGYETFLPLVSRNYTDPASLPYLDHFGDDSSGWFTGSALRYNAWCRYYDVDCHEGWEEVTYLSYFENNYRFYVPLTWHGGGDVDTWFVWPIQAAPLPEYYYPLPDRYCVEARGLFANWMDQDYQPWWAHWGIAFGSNETITDVYTFQVNANHDAALLRYYNYIYPGNRQPLTGEPINVEIPIKQWSFGDMPYLIPSHVYNTLKVVVKGTTVDTYINGVPTGNHFVGDMPRDRIGLIGGSWEVTPIDIRIDYFRYDPNCPEVK